MDNLLGKPIKDADYDLDREYHATAEGSDEDEESEESDDKGKRYNKPGQRKGRCH